MKTNPTFCWFWHKWSPWERYAENWTAYGKNLPPSGVRYEEFFQWRTCQRCHYTQSERIGS